MQVVSPPAGAGEVFPAGRGRGHGPGREAGLGYGAGASVTREPGRTGRNRWKLIDGELPAVFVSDGGETLSGVSDPDEGVSGLDEERPHLAGPRPPVGDRLATRVPRHAGYHGHNAPAVLSGMLLAALLITPVLWLGRDGLPGAVAWLLCAPAVSVLFAGVRSGFPRGALSDDLTWSEREEGDPSIR